MNRPRLVRMVLILAVMALVPAAMATAPVSAADAPTAIRMRDSTFDPARVEVAAAAGMPSQFEFTNEDGVTHTVTADNGSFDSGDVNPGAKFSLSVSGTGEVKYHCKIHGAPGVGMTGTLVILEPVTRLSGIDRIATAVATSQSVFPNGGAGAAVLARADHFPDALAGTPLAVVKQGPLLLTPTAGLDNRVSAELRRAVPSGAKVYLLGGRQALSEQVATDVSALGYQTVRLEGATRAATAATICERGIEQVSTVVVEVTGLDFADALAAGSGASQVGACILLTNGTQQSPETAAYLEGKTSQRWAVGGAAAAADPQATKVVGTDRYDTSVKVAEEFFASPAAVGLATGSSFPDGLGGGAHAGRVHAPLLLVSRDGVHVVVRDYLVAHAGSLSQGFVYGGPSAVGDPVMACVQRAISGLGCP